MCFNILHGYHGTKNRIKGPFFLGCVLINVGKHAETESLIKNAFQTKVFSKIRSEQILTHAKKYLHKMIVLNITAEV